LDALSAVVQIYLYQNNLNAARERVEQQLTKTKNQAGAYQLLGQINIASKDYAKGIQNLEKALEINPNLFSAYFLIGNAYAAQQKFDTALEEYDKILKKNPKAIQPQMMIAIIYDLRNQPQKANEYYQKILDLNKDFYPAANNLAWNYAEHGGSLDIALGLAQKARETNPNDPSIGDTLGWIYYKKGAYGTALGLLKESNEKMKNSNPTVLYHLGMAAYKMGDESLARDSLNKAVTSGQKFSGVEEAKKTLTEIKPSSSK
jgi:tetratricopeptide (TPR) repeat protein